MNHLLSNLFGNVTVSRIYLLQQKYASRTSKELARITDVEVIDDFKHNNLYGKIHHGLGLEVLGKKETDPGYFYFEDTLFDRKIYVTTKNAAHSLAFHQDMELNGFFNVIKKDSTHESFFNMSKLKKKWFLDNLRYICFIDVIIYICA